MDAKLKAEKDKLTAEWQACMARTSEITKRLAEIQAINFKNYAPLLDKAKKDWSESKTEKAKLQNEKKWLELMLEMDGIDPKNPPERYLNLKAGEWSHCNRIREIDAQLKKMK